MAELILPKQKAEASIRGLEDPINTHLVKLATIQAGPSRSDARWRHELVTWLWKIARIRIKPATRPATAAYYFRILYDEPYGGNEAHNVQMQLALLARDHTLDTRVAAAEVATRLEKFHQEFARGCAGGVFDLDDVVALVERFGGGPQPG